MTHRGFGTLPVVMMIALGSLLMLFGANRALILESRAATLAERSVVAHQAAEGGLAWARAWINRPEAIDDRCERSPGTERPWRTRQWPTATTSSTSAPSGAACTRDGPDNWTCRCSTSSPSSPDDANDHPAFSVSVDTGPRTDTVWLNVIGCSSASQCPEPTPQDARARSRQLLAPWPLGEAPGAALVVRESTQIGAGVTLGNPDRNSNGITLSSAQVANVAAAARLESLPGRPGSDSVRAPDTRWIDNSGTPESAARWFHRLYGLPAAALRTLPGLTTLDCRSGCRTRDLVSALDTGSRWLWLDGPLTLDSAHGR